LSNIIDAHSHIFPDKISLKASQSIGEFYDITMACEGSLANLLAQQERAGIDLSVICSVATVPEQAQSINNFIASCASEHPGRLLGFGSLHPFMEHPGDEVERIISLGLKGIKLHPDFQRFHIDDPKAYPLYEAAAGRLPVLFHTGDCRYEYSHPARLKKVLSDFPALTAIAAHFGGWSVWEDGADYLADLENVYVDTCSSLYSISPQTALKLIDRFGAQRVLFGTDFPMWNPGEELERFDKIPLSEEQRRMILHENARRLLNI